MTNQKTVIVSIIIPCYNVEAIYQQTFPRAHMEVIIADGHSVDRTREEVLAFQQAHKDLEIKLVDNPRRIIPTALNTAIAHARGEIILRLDAHSAPAVDYVERCVERLRDGVGDNVGGVWDILPGKDDWIGRSIAAAAAHPLGVGDALYRHARQASIVDTVPFGAFFRSLIDQIGAYDESLLSNEDYEFNARIRLAGGKVFLDPEIRSRYFARPNLGALARQYFRYGYWKLNMLRRYPGTLRWRQALPPLFVAGILGLAVFAVFFFWARWLLLLALGSYFLTLVMGALPVAVKRRDASLIIGMPLAVVVMHFCWGSGFLFALLRGKG